jgi:hypothetical protein
MTSVAIVNVFELQKKVLVFSEWIGRLVSY